MRSAGHGEEQFQTGDGKTERRLFRAVLTCNALVLVILLVPGTAQGVLSGSVAFSNGPAIPPKVSYKGNGLRMTITITNNDSSDRTGITFSTNYPKNLYNVSPSKFVEISTDQPSAASPCTAVGAIAYSQGGSGIGTGSKRGFGLQHGRSCVIAFDVASNYTTSPGFPMTVTISNLKFAGVPPNTTPAFSDSAEFKLFAPILTTSITPSKVPLNSGLSSTLSITIKNIDKDMGLRFNPYEAISNFTFNQSYPAGPATFRNATVPNVTFTPSCGSPKIVAMPEGDSIAVEGQGATVPAFSGGVYGTCTITVAITAALEGPHATLFASAVSSDNAISSTFGSIPFWAGSLVPAIIA